MPAKKAAPKKAKPISRVKQLDVSGSQSRTDTVIVRHAGGETTIEQNLIDDRGRKYTKVSTEARDGFYHNGTPRSPWTKFFRVILPKSYG